MLFRNVDLLILRLCNQEMFSLTRGHDISTEIMNRNAETARIQRKLEHLVKFNFLRFFSNRATNYRLGWFFVKRVKRLIRLGLENIRPYLL